MKFSKQKPLAALAPVLALAGLPVLGQAQDEDKTAGATVEVTATLGADPGYRSATTSAPGPLGTKNLMDIPNEVVILPAALMENMQVESFKESLKYLPLTQFQEMQGSEILRPATRGMQGSNYQNTRMDGMTIFCTGANGMEQYQQLEVFSGLPSAMFGPSNPSGVFNFVSKRPTSERLIQADIGYESSSVYTAHVDLGGKVDDKGILGYRLNLQDSHGTAWVDASELYRRLASLGIDVHPFSEATLEINMSSYHLQQKGFPGWFTYGENVALPAAPDPTKAGLGEPYAGVTLHNNTLDAKWTQVLGADWVLVVGALTQGVDRNINTAINGLTDNTGDYKQTFANGFAPHFGITSDIAYLNGTFKTGAITHDMTLGTTGFRATTNSPFNTPSAASILLGISNVNDPRQFPENPAGLPDVGDQYLSSVSKQQGVNISDTIGFNEHWMLKLAISQDWMQTRNFAKTGAQTTAYDQNGLSPMPSLIWKPTQKVTVYTTYASSLQQGDLAPAGTTNANQALPPYRSDQTEVGIKVALARIDLTAALFRVERPFNNIINNTYQASGEQVNKGFEATAIGRLSDNLTTYSGVTLINSELQNTGNPATDGKNYVGLPQLKSNILLEYAIPAVKGLVATGDWQYTAKRPADDTNLYYVPAYSLVDLGVRYSTRLWGNATTWRLLVENVGNVHYYSTIGPSNITGSNSGNLTAHQGAPRTVSASMSMRF